MPINMNSFIENIEKSIAVYKFRKAANEINTTKGNKYMCFVLARNVNKVKVFEKFGFNRNNYHKFVIEHYSHLIPLLINNGSAWINFVYIDTFIDIIRSKKDFLCYLADNLDKELKPCKFYKLYMTIGKILYKYA